MLCIPTPTLCYTYLDNISSAFVELKFHQQNFWRLQLMQNTVIICSVMSMAVVFVDCDSSWHLQYCYCGLTQEGVSCVANFITAYEESQSNRDSHFLFCSVFFVSKGNRFDVYLRRGYICWDEMKFNQIY